MEQVRGGSDPFLRSQDQIDEEGYILGDVMFDETAGGDTPMDLDDVPSNEDVVQELMEAVLDDAIQTSLKSVTGRPPIQLYMSCNPDHLSPYQCEIRRHVELFEAKDCDVLDTTKGRNKQLVLGQVGIRCGFCQFRPAAERARGSMYFPQKLMGIYQAAQILANGHLMDTCEDVPAEYRENLRKLKEQAKSYRNYLGQPAAGKDYWATTAQALGVYETEDEGLRFEASVGIPGRGPPATTKKFNACPLKKEEKSA